MGFAFVFVNAIFITVWNFVYHHLDIWDFFFFVFWSLYAMYYRALYLKLKS